MKPGDTIYRGRRLLGPANQHLGVEVTVNGLPFTAWRSQRLWNHSPTGFEWGYGGSGPAQLALALLYDATQSRSIAMKYYQDFKWRVVANWGPEWQITVAEICYQLGRIAGLEEVQDMVELGRRLNEGDPEGPSIEEAVADPAAFVREIGGAS